MDIFKFNVVVLPAVRALDAPPLHRPLIEGVRDCAGPLDGGGADLHSLGIVESDLSGHCQFPWVALFAGRHRPAVPLVPNHIADGLGCQSVGLGGAAKRQYAAGVRLLQDGVATVPALG